MFVISDISYDVEKTNSMVTPYIGYIEFTEIIASNKKDAVSSKYKLILSFQHDKWVLKDIKLNFAGEWVDWSSEIESWKERLGIL